MKNKKKVFKQNKQKVFKKNNKKKVIKMNHKKKVIKKIKRKNLDKIWINLEIKYQKILITNQAIIIIKNIVKIN